MSTQTSPNVSLDEQATDPNTEAAVEESAVEGEQVGDIEVEQEAGVETQPTAEELQEIESKKQSRFERQRTRYETEMQKQREEIEFLRKLATGTNPQATAVADSEEPKIEDYDGKSITEYIQARDRYLEGKLSKQAEERARLAYQREKVIAEHNKKVEETKKVFKDWDEVMVIDDDDVEPMQDSVNFIFESEVGPSVAYHLKKNPDLHEKLNKMSPTRRIAELGKLEDKFLTKAEPVATRKVTNAPAKMTEAKGKTSIAGTDENAAAAARQGYAAWKAADQARQAALKKR